MSNERRTVRVSIYDDDKHHYDDPGAWPSDGTLADFIAWHQAMLDEVPAEYRNTAEIDIHTYDDYGSASIEVDLYYERPETDSEMAARIAAERAEEARMLAKRRAKYEALKREFGK